MQIKLTFLGTGTSTGVPIIASNHPVRLSKNLKDKRLRSSVKISWLDNTYIIDCGGDFRQQIIREDINRIDGILFTHEHADHVAGLDDIRGFCFKQGSVPIYLQERVLKSLEKRYDYIFAKENRYPSAPEVNANIISHKENFRLKNLQIIPIEVMHGTLPILGYRFGNIAYLTDIKYLNEIEKNKLHNLDILVVTCLKKETHSSHLNYDEALSFINEIKPKKAYLTHISERLGFHDEVQKGLPKNVFLAYDGLEVSSEF